MATIENNLALLFINSLDNLDLYLCFSKSILKKFESTLNVSLFSVVDFLVEYISKQKQVINKLLISIEENIKSLISGKINKSKNNATYLSTRLDELKNNNNLIQNTPILLIKALPWEENEYTSLNMTINIAHKLTSTTPGTNFSVDSAYALFNFLHNNYDPEEFLVVGAGCAAIETGLFCLYKTWWKKNINKPIEELPSFLMSDLFNGPCKYCGLKPGNNSKTTNNFGVNVTPNICMTCACRNNTNEKSVIICIRPPPTTKSTGLAQHINGRPYVVFGEPLTSGIPDNFYKFLHLPGVGTTIYQLIKNNKTQSDGCKEDMYELIDSGYGCTFSGKAELDTDESAIYRKFEVYAPTNQPIKRQMSDEQILRIIESYNISQKLILNKLTEDYDEETRKIDISVMHHVIKKLENDNDINNTNILLFLKIELFIRMKHIVPSIFDLLIANQKLKGISNVRVVTHNLLTRDMNMMCGELISFNNSKNRWLIRFNQKKFYIKSENLYIEKDNSKATDLQHILETFT